MILQLALPLLSLFQLTVSEDDKKWVWKKGNNERTSKNSRYQVIEDGPFDFDRPDRPLGLHQGLGFPERPFPNGPGTGVFTNERPPYPQHQQQHHHHPPEQGILTGPVPSWVKEPPFKHYDKCKCAEKFNCNSPGISYGECDIGKQYCCYNSNGVVGGPLPSRPIHSPGNGVLVGPGGPVDFPPHRPHHYHQHDGGGPGILVGPGGPTGVIGRPPYRPFDRPIHNPNLGVLVGPHNEPFRPPEVPYAGPYGRRSDPKKTKDV